MRRREFAVGLAARVGRVGVEHDPDSWLFQPGQGDGSVGGWIAVEQVLGVIGARRPLPGAVPVSGVSEARRAALG